MLVNGRSPGLLRASPHPSSISSPALGPPPPAREYLDQAIIMMDDGDSSVGRRGQSLPAPQLSISIFIPIPIPLHCIALDFWNIDTAGW